MTNQHLKGFTLIELIVTIAVLGVIATLAIPSFITWFKRYEIEHIIGLSQTMLHEARNISLMHRQYVVVCPTHNNSICQKDGATDIISFVDTNKNKRRDADEKILSSNHINLHYGEIQFNVGRHLPYIRYFPDTGKPRGYMSNITYCPDDGDMHFAKSIIMDEHGRARYSFDKNGDGIDENSRGENIHCF